MADPGEGPGAPLFFGQNEARRAEKIYLETGPSLSEGLDDRPPPPLSEGLDPSLILLLMIIKVAGRRLASHTVVLRGSSRIAAV